MKEKHNYLIKSKISLPLSIIESFNLNLFSHFLLNVFLVNNKLEYYCFVRMIEMIRHQNPLMYFIRNDIHTGVEYYEENQYQISNYNLNFAYFSTLKF